MKKWIALFAFSILSASLWGQSVSGSIPSTDNARCISIGADSQGVVAISVTGTWTGTLQPEVSIGGDTPVNTNVTPFGSSTAQATITANGGFRTTVAGATTFLICGNTVASGTANIKLNVVKLAANLNSGTGNGNGSVTSVTFTGDGVVESSTPSAAVTTSGTVTATLANAPAGSVLSNNTGVAAAPAYNQTLTLGLNGGTGGSVALNGATSGTGTISVGATGSPITSSTTIQATKFSTTTNCAGVGTSANPSVATCASAASGAVSCATASGGVCQVNTSQVTANSIIILQQTSNTAVGTRLSVTCNTTVSTLLPMVTSQSAGASFTFTITAPTTNPACFYYEIFN